MIKSWYYIKDGNKQGPVLETELKLMASSGTLLPNDLVWSSGMVRWVQAHSIKSLFNKEPSAASESPGPPPLPPPLPLSQINSSKETLKLIIDKSQFVWNGLNSKLIMKIFATRLPWQCPGPFYLIDSKNRSPCVPENVKVPKCDCANTHWELA